MDTQSELDPRNKEAIQAALEGRWLNAIELNTQLFEEYPEDINIINRLGHAYTEQGQINKARATFKKVLETDPYNPIAMRNLERLSALRSADIKPKESVKVLDLDTFIEEPGKTKTVQVVDLAMPKVLIILRTGDTVKLNTTKSEVTVISEDNKRLGKIEDTWGKEIAEAINLGSEFDAVVKSVKAGKDPANSKFSVFLREIKRSKKLAHPTFPVDTNFTPYVREETLSYLKDHDDSGNHTEGQEEHEDVEVPEAHDDEETPGISRPAAENIVEDEEDFST